VALLLVLMPFARAANGTRFLWGGITAGADGVRPKSLGIALFAVWYNGIKPALP